MSARKRLPQNIITYSEQFQQNPPWGQFFIAGMSITPNAVASPEPAAPVTADQLDFAVTTSYLYCGINAGSAFTVPGRTYTFSVWLRSPSKAMIALAATSAAFKTIALSNVWTLYSYTFVATVTNHAPGLDNRVAVGGDGLAGTVYAWGAQFEQSDAPGDYVPAAGVGANVATAPARRRQPQNANIRSNDINNWVTKNNVTAALNATGPDGAANTASTVTDSNDGAPTQHYASNSAGGISSATMQVGATWCFSAIVKAGTLSKMALCPGGAAYQITYDLAAGVVGQSLNAAPKAFGIIPMGGSWYRVWMTYAATAADLNANNNRLYLVTSLASLNYQGTGTGTLLVSDVTLEQSDYPGDVARTAATQVNLTIAPARRRQGQNLVYPSEAIASAPWADDGTATRTNNYATAPDGSNTATRIQWTAGAPGAKYVYPTASTTVTGGWSCASVWMRATSGTASVRLRVCDAVGVSNVHSADIALDTTWRRYYLAVRVTKGGITNQTEFESDSAGTAADFLAWGYQHELSNAPGDYTKSIAAAVNPTIAPPLRRTA